MAHDQNSKKDPKGPPSSFTVDNDASGIVTMPNITRLLNRKSLGLPGGSNTSIPKIPTPPVVPPPFQGPEAPHPKIELAAPDEYTMPISQPDSAPPFHSPNQLQGDISLLIQAPGVDFVIEPSPAGPTSSFEEVEPAADSEPARAEPTPPALRIQVAKPRVERRTASRLILWDAKQLKSGADPIGRALWMFLDKGAKSALFLSITTPPAGSPVPHFTGTAAIAPQPKLQLWTGLKWDPTVVPELWNQFVRVGFVELGPPATETNIKSNRNVVRAAFGVGQDEWLLLVRAGSGESCRGALALISLKSLAAEVPAIQALITTPLKKASA